MEVLAGSAAQVLDTGSSGGHAGRQEHSGPMFDWRKKKAGPTEAQREAYLKRLAEVLGRCEDEFLASETSQPTPFTKSLEGNAEPEVSRTC